MSGNGIPIPVYRSESTSSGASDLSTVRPREVYVIIGRGFAAVANHLTLRASTNPEVRARVDRCRFVIIGGDEPWQARGPTPMGQFPHLLRLPAYKSLRGDESYALASDFGGYIRDAEKELGNYLDVDMDFLKSGWVGLIETRDQKKIYIPQDEEERRDPKEVDLVGPGQEEWAHPGAPYRLSVYWKDPAAKKRKLYFLYAHYIDVCTGPGPARLLDSDICEYGEGMMALHAGMPDDQPDYGKLKSIVKGDHHIGAPLPLGSDKLILVYGASASGAWSAEHVLNKGGGAKLHWGADQDYAPKDLRGKPYNDLMEGYFMHPQKANAPGGRNLEIVKKTADMRFLGRITNLEKGSGGGKIKVTFAVPGDALDWRAKITREYDQVVITVGQVNSLKTVSSSAYLTQALGKMRPQYARDLWSKFRPRDQDIPVAITDGRGAVRILGAAIASAAGLDVKFTADFKMGYEKHYVSLPIEGRAGGNSLLTAAATIELANRCSPGLVDVNRCCNSLITRALHSTAANSLVESRCLERVIRPVDPQGRDLVGKGHMSMDEIARMAKCQNPSAIFAGPFSADV